MPTLACYSLLPSAADRVDAALAGTGSDTPIDLSSVMQYLGPGAQSTNAGIGMSGERIAIRVEVGPNVTAESDWAEFFAGQFPDRLGTNQWSVYVDQDIVIQYAIAQAKARLPQDGSFVLRSEPTGSWLSSGRGVRLSIPGTVPDNPPLGVDVDVDVSVSCEFFVPTGDELRYTLNYSYDADNWDIAELVLSGMLVGAWAGLTFAPIGALIGGVVGGIVVGIVAATAEPDVTTPAECTETGDQSMECVQPWHPPRSPLFGTMHLDGLLPCSDGLVLEGSVAHGVTYGRPELSVHAFSFRWGVRGSCSSGFGIACAGGVRLTNVGHAPLCICGTRVLDDPLGQFATMVVSGADAGDPAWFAGDIGIALSELDPAYLQSPYPWKILIKTNGGARLVAIPAPLDATESERHDLAIAATGAKAKCIKAVEPFWAATGRINPGWIPDPPPDATVAHLWQVYVRGLAPGEEVSLLDYGKRTVATGVASPKGILRLGALLSPSSRSKQISIVRKARERAASAPRGEERAIVIRQDPLVWQSAIALDSICTSLSSALYGHSPCLFVTTLSGLRIYDLRRPGLPALHRVVLAEGLLGTMTWGNGFLAWGRRGMVLHSRSALHPVPIRQDSPVLGAVYAARHMYVLTDESLLVLDRNLETLHAVRVADAGATQISLCSAGLLVSSASGAELFDLDDPTSPLSAGRVEVPGGLHELPLGVAPARATLSKPSRGDWEIYAVDEPSRVRRVAVYHQEPWFAGLARIGDQLARLSSDRTRVQLYQSIGARML